METILRTKQLSKNFSGKLAMNSVDIEVKKGDIYGFIGKNGAGKTTFIRTVVGLASPTSGSIELFGSSNLNKGRRKIGTVIEYPAVYPNFTAKQNLYVQGQLLGNANKNRILEILKTVGLGDTGRKKAKDFSLGMKQRLAIAIALMGDPEFLILDEPINGLDPTGIKDVRDLVLHLNHEFGITILMSSHILGELSKIATCYGVISNGVLVDQFTAKELEERVKKCIEIEVDDIDIALNVIKHYIRVDNFDVLDNKIRLYEHLDSTGIINSVLVKNGVMVESISCKGEDYEPYFINLMEGNTNV